VTKHILQQLLAQPFVQERYYISDVDGRTFHGWYGVVLLIDIRLRISHLSLINFPQSTMGRRLLLAEIKLANDEILRIGTVHLESLDNKEERLCQLNICRNAFNRSPATCILMGDFNFPAHGQENIDQFKALPEWIDVWLNLIGTHNPGFTFDTETNPMTKYNTEASARSRIDRIILQSQTWIPTEIEILGTRRVGKQEYLDIFPSDHFGLTAVFEKRK
jgi:endonuclease/exonuclease/phosphatase family metal-dependent hydrolase